LGNKLVKKQKNTHPPTPKTLTHLQKSTKPNS
jgi:hypothetical protein